MVSLQGFGMAVSLAIGRYPLGSGNGCRHRSNVGDLVLDFPVLTPLPLFIILPSLKYS